MTVPTTAEEAGMPRCADYAPDLAARYRCTADAPSRPMPAAPVLPEIARLDPDADPAQPGTVFNRLLARSGERARTAA